MELMLIIVLLTLGMLLVFVEIFFIPGTTIVGILGIILAGVGVYFAFRDYGNVTGFISLVITIFAVMVALIIGFRSGAWEKLSHKEIITGRVNTEDVINVKVGDKGKALSAMRPMGKARIGKFTVEVSSLNQFIDAGTEVEVVKITQDRIFVRISEKNSTESDREEDQIIT